MQWPQGVFEPRVIDDVALEGQVRRICNRDSTDLEAIRTAAQLIYGWHTPIGTASQQYQQFLDIVYSVARIGSTGSSVKRLDALCVALVCLGATRVQLSSYVAKKAYEVQETAEQLTKKGDKGAAWWVTILQPFVQLYVSRWKNIDMLKALKPQEVQYWLDLSAGQDITAMADQGALGIANIRHYGVKPCVMDDGMMHPVGTAWIFSDGFELRNRLSPQDAKLITRALTDTILADSADIRRADSLAPFSSSLTLKDSTYLGFPLASRAATTITVDGQLFIDAQFGMTPVESYFAEAGLRELFPVFHLLHIMRLYDLVVPAEAMRQKGVPGWPARSTRRSDRADFRKVPFLRTLVVPRLRLLGEQRLLDAAHLREMDESAIKTEKLMRKKMARHEIPGFVRPLQEGHLASDTARQLAWQELGIRNLPDGYTYVRAHVRGSEDNPAKGHIARRRKLL